MTELNKNSFYFYLLKKGSGKIDLRNIDFMIDTLKEWLPENSPDIDKDDMDAYELGQREYKDFIMENLK
jgi:hypothetical protein